MALSGPRLSLALGVALLAMTAAVLSLSGTDEPGLRALIRATARSSVALFLLAFAARPLRSLWRSDASAWLLRNRRWLGLGFAISHGIHGVALVWFATAHPESYRSEVPTSTVVLGGIGFAFAAAMAATSSDAAVRALGRVRWQRLHRAGMWWLWAIFLATFGGALSANPRAVYAIATTGLLAAAGLRIAAGLRRRRT